jgi:Asp-tRNA(Asn)/Glu-tRNA(Gln) amidotransferase A subunit family amidase
VRVLESALAQSMGEYYGKVFERYAFRDEARRFFETHDLLVSPVLPIASLDVGKNIPDHLQDRNLVSWVFYTYPFNLTGQPAATVCAGITADDMPVGIQILGRALGEYDVVRAAAALERTRPAGYNVRAFESSQPRIYIYNYREFSIVPGKNSSSVARPKWQRDPSYLWSTLRVAFRARHSSRRPSH